MEKQETLSTVLPLLRSRALRVLLIAAPGVMGALAIITATLEPDLGWSIVLNIIGGIVISSVLFLVVSFAARRVADDRISLVKAAEEGHWKARARALSIRNEEDGLYADWYFRLRLQEEIDRCTRYGTRFSVLLARPAFIHNELEARATSGLFFDKVRRHLRRSDLPAILKDGALAVMLPQTGRDGAVQRRIKKALARVDVETGQACFPEDAEQVEALLEAAVRDAQESREQATRRPHAQAATA